MRVALSATVGGGGGGGGADGDAQLVMHLIGGQHQRHLLVESDTLPCSNRFQVVNQTQREEKGWVAHPPHPSVRQILEGSTFSNALALEANPLAQGQGVCRLVPSLLNL